MAWKSPENGTLEKWIIIFCQLSLRLSWLKTSLYKSKKCLDSSIIHSSYEYETSKEELLSTCHSKNPDFLLGKSMLLIGESRNVFQDLLRPWVRQRRHGGRLQDLRGTSQKVEPQPVVDNLRHLAIIRVCRPTARSLMPGELRPKIGCFLGNLINF